MVALPSASAVNFPFSTFTAAGLLLLQVTVLSVTFSGNTVAFSTSISPTFMVSDIWSSRTSVTATGFTVTLQVAV